MALTDQDRQLLQEAQAKAGAFAPNIEGTHSQTTTSTTSPNSSSVSTVNAGAKSTMAEGRTEYTPAAQQGARQRYEEVMKQHGYAKNIKGEWVPNDSSLGSVLKMQKYNEEMERVNKAKALNAGLVNLVATIGDMISAGAGGNVYKRDANTIAADAAKDTITRRDAQKNVEIAAAERDKENMMKALKSAQDAHDKYLELNGIKRTSQYTSPYDEVRHTDTKGGTNTQTSTGTKSRDSIATAPVRVYSADGTSRVLNVNKAKADAYNAQAWSDIISLNPVNNRELMVYAGQRGYIDSNNAWRPSLAATILTDPEIIKHLPEGTKRMNRELYYDSEEYARYIYSDEWKNLTEEQKLSKAKAIARSVNGGGGSTQRTFGNVGGNPNEQENEYDD